MQKLNKEIKPKDRSLDKRAVAAGVIGLVGLAAACFLLGLYCLGPMMQSHVRTPSEVSRAPRYVPPLNLEAESPKNSEEQPALDVEITEQGENKTASTDSGVKQDGNTLNITLDRESTSDSNKKPVEVNKPEKPRVATEHENRPARETAEKSSFRVQAGTFANKSNADVLVASLKDQGFNPEIKTVQSVENTLYRVQLGTYKTREDARKMADDLTAHGYSPSIVAE